MLLDEDMVLRVVVGENDERGLWNSVRNQEGEVWGEINDRQEIKFSVESRIELSERVNSRVGGANLGAVRLSSVIL